MEKRPAVTACEVQHNAPASGYGTLRIVLYVEQPSEHGRCKRVTLYSTHVTRDNAHRVALEFITLNKHINRMEALFTAVTEALDIR